MTILLADDDRSLRRVIQFKLEQHGYTVSAVEDGPSALAALQSTEYDLLLSDIKMPGMDGLELLEKAVKLRPDLKVILITAHATIEQAVQAVKLGAFDYITKPFEDEELMVTIQKALKFKNLENENRTLREKLARRSEEVSLIGISDSFKKMLTVIDRIAATDATILISGESGTGKEIVARTIHNRSNRSEGAFVAVNCAAIPRDLLESELFGHKRGAFTGAVKDKRGKFELASGGTLLLDEVGEMAVDLQAKLLRALQERMIEPIGAEQPIAIDARVIGATNTNLRELVSEGKFREDLYYRLNVIPIKVPSLRERRDDIPVLANTFVRKFAPESKVEVGRELMQALSNYDWPGNVRELENMMERMVILRRSDTLTPDDLPEDFSTRQPQMELSGEDETNEHVTFGEAERALVIKALKKNGWNRSRAARYLNIPRHVLIYRIKKYNISEND